MCFRGRRVVRVVVAAIALSAIVPMPVRASQSQPEPPAAASPDAAEIARALAAVRADPNLATERTIPTLHWRDTSRANRSPTPAWLTWTTGLFKWLDQSARVLLWGTAATLVGLLAVFIVRRVRKFNLARDELASILACRTVV